MSAIVLLKYSNEFKLKVAQYYIEQKLGIESTVKYFNTPSVWTVRKWFKKYQEPWFRRIIKKSKSSYSGDFKQNVIEYMHENHLLLQETSFRFNLWHYAIVSKCEHIYYEEETQSLYIERRGRSKNMSSKPKKKKLNKEVEEDLIEEVQRLRMENEY